MYLETNKITKPTVETSFVDDFCYADLPDFVEVKEDEELVFLYDDEYSMKIITKEQLDEEIIGIQKGYDGYKPEVLKRALEDFYSLIIGTTKVRRDLKIDLDTVEYFLDEETKRGDSPLYFQNLNGTLKMYYGVKEFRNGLAKRHGK